MCRYRAYAHLVFIVLAIGLLAACGGQPPLKTGNWQGMGDKVVGSFTVANNDQIQNMKLEAKTGPLATCQITIDTIAIKPDRTFMVSQKSPDDDFQLDGTFTGEGAVTSKLAIRMCHGSATLSGDGIVTQTFEWTGRAGSSPGA